MWTDVCIDAPSLVFAANEEYYQMLMINDSQPPGFDVSSYTIEEINSITSEYTLKNTVSTFDLHPIIKKEHPKSVSQNCSSKKRGYIFSNLNILKCKDI